MSHLAEILQRRSRQLVQPKVSAGLGDGEDCHRDSSKIAASTGRGVATTDYLIDLS
jgi:hypothetical protein